MRALALLLLASLAATISAYGTPGATFEARDYTKWTRRHENSKRGTVRVDFTDASGK
jgi:hypothetical protein